jgi:hypothetical protein
MPFDGNAKFWPRKPKRKIKLFGDDSDELTTADCQQLDTACMKYMRRATGHIRPARLTPHQRALARKNRKLWADSYTARLGAAERVFAMDQ